MPMGFTRQRTTCHNSKRDDTHLPFSGMINELSIILIGKIG